MKLILTVDSVKPPLTGIGRYTWELATRLGRGAGVEELRLFDRGHWVAQPEDLLNKSGGFVVPLGTVASRALRAGYRMVAPAWQAWTLRNQGASLFHSTNFYLPRFPGPAVVTVHDLSILKYPEFHPPERVAHLKAVIPKVVRRAHHLITDSEFTRQEVIETFGLSEDQVTAVGLGVQPEFHPANAGATLGTLGPLGLAHGEYTLCVATMEPRKNIQGLLAAYRALSPRTRERYPLVLAGHKGWNSRAIHDEILSGVREGWLRYLGYVSDQELPLLFAGARLFVFPSWYEGYGLPVLQAMASGVPCVVSNASSLPEVAGGSGLLFDPRDSDAFHAALTRGLSDESWRSSATTLGLALAKERTWDRCADETLAVYQRVIRQFQTEGQTAARPRHPFP